MLIVANKLELVIVVARLKIKEEERLNKVKYYIKKECTITCRTKKYVYIFYSILYLA